MSLSYMLSNSYLYTAVVELSSCDSCVWKAKLVCGPLQSLPNSGLDCSFVWKVILIPHLTYGKKLFPLV